MKKYIIHANNKIGFRRFEGLTYVHRYGEWKQSNADDEGAHTFQYDTREAAEADLKTAQEALELQGWPHALPAEVIEVEEDEE